jgi:transcription elongation factor Elf1
MKTWLVMSWSGMLLVLARFFRWSSRTMRKPVPSLVEKAIMPCPKCGGEGDAYYEQGMEATQVIVCTKCNYWGEAVSDDLMKAIDLWNRKR